MVIKRIDPISCAKISGTLYALLGLIIGALLSVSALIGGFAGRSNTSATPAAMLGVSAVIGVGAIIFCPVIYGAMGFIGSLIAAALYNLLARSVGGIRVEVE